MSTALAERDERRSLSFRMPRRAVELIDRAAAQVHKDRTEFVLEAAVRQAEDVLRDQTVFRLSEKDYDRFIAVLDDPPPANEHLKALMRRKPVWEK